MSFIGKNIKKIRTVKKLSQAAFAELFNLARPSVGAYEEGRSEPKIDTVIAMANHFSLSTDALLRKELSVNELYSLDILKGEFDPTRMPPALGKSSKTAIEAIPGAPTSITMESTSAEGVPLIDREAVLEYIVNLGNRDFIGKQPTIQLPREGKRLHRAFVYSGQEMQHNECGLNQGDVLLCKRQTKENLLKQAAGKIYLFVTREGFITRRLAAATPEAVDLKADNPAFENINLKMTDILEIWEVSGIWSRHLAPPAQLENRIFQVESRLERLEKRLGPPAGK